MIGAPMNFKHTGHIGSGEVSTGFDIHNVQDQMQSKGGYKFTCALSETAPDGLDLSANENQENGNQENENQENEALENHVNENNQETLPSQSVSDIAVEETKNSDDHQEASEHKQEDEQVHSSEPNRTSNEEQEEELRQTGLC